MNAQTQTFDAWAIVELFGHTRIAGRCTEQNIAGTNMLRVDVPEVGAQPAFSKLYGSSAIYAITPVDEFTARSAAQSMQKKPLDAWDINTVFEKYQALKEDKRLIEAEINDERNREFFEEDDNDF